MGQGRPVRPPRLVIVEEDPHRRCLQVVELTGAGGPEKQADGDRRDQQREWKQDEDRFHIQASASAAAAAGRLVRAKVRVRTDESTTVSEDTGISTAASSGETMPASASAEAPAL